MAVAVSYIYVETPLYSTPKMIILYVIFDIKGYIWKSYSKE